MSRTDKSYPKELEEEDQVRFQEEQIEERVDDHINPSYYSDKNIEPIDVIEDWGLDHYLACCIKYISRIGHKGGAATSVVDLGKAIWYLERKRFIEWKKEPKERNT